MIPTRKAQGLNQQVNDRDGLGYVAYSRCQYAYQVRVTPPPVHVMLGPDSGKYPRQSSRGPNKALYSLQKSASIAENTQPILSNPLP